ncbi:MAG: hypothetical protein ABI539_00330 [Acidobacteriota bacterium]
MRVTINMDPAKSLWDNPGVDVGLDSIHAWIANKQISPVGMSVGGDSFGLELNDGTRLLFLAGTKGTRVTVTPPSKRK